jgi:intracellular multiplication protein IcmT
MDIHWRNTQKPVRFFFMDARAFSGVLFLLVHFRVWVLTLCAIMMIIFWLFERRGLAFGPALRSIRSWLIGRHRPANPRWSRRRYVDYCGR